MKEQQRKIDQLQLYSAKLLDKGTVNDKGAKFTYGGYFTVGYDLQGNFCYRFIVDDSLVIDL